MDGWMREGEDGWRIERGWDGMGGVCDVLSPRQDSDEQVGGGAWMQVPTESL